MPERNEHERRAWQRLVDLGATRTEIGGKPALDVRTARLRTSEQVADFTGALINAAGRSRAVRRHVDRQNRPVFLVTDDEGAREARPREPEPELAVITDVIRAARLAGFQECNEPLVRAVLAGTAMRAAAGAGVTDELRALILREAKEAR